MHFESPSLLAELEAADSSSLDAAGFGVVRMAHDGTVLAYNSYESQLSGLSPASVVGRGFFTQVAPCTNNFMVAEPFAAPGPLDTTLNYVFTYKMRPTKVRLRLLKRAGGAEQYLVIEKV